MNMLNKTQQNYKTQSQFCNKSPGKKKVNSKINNKPNQHHFLANYIIRQIN